MYGWILFVVLSTYHAGSGLTITSAEFSTKEKCEAAADQAKAEFKTFWTQEPKTLCVQQ